MNQKFIIKYCNKIRAGHCFAQFALCIKAYFFRVTQFALRIYKAICVCANAQIAQTVLDYLPKCCNSAFVKVIVLNENVKKNRNWNIDIANNVTNSRV